MYSTISTEADRYRVLAEDLMQNYAGIDEETLTDTLEGESELPGLLKAALRSSLLDEALASGLKTRLDEMRTRQERLLVPALRNAKGMHFSELLQRLMGRCRAKLRNDREELADVGGQKFPEAGSGSTWLPNKHTTESSLNDHVTVVLSAEMLGMAQVATHSRSLVRPIVL